MTPALQHSLLLSAAAIAGFFAGRVPRPTDSSSAPAPAPVAEAPANETAATPAPSAPRETKDPSIAGYSDIQGFNTLSVGEQTTRLLRISALFEQRTEQRRFGPPTPENGIPPGLQIWLARAVADLSTDQTAALLESLATAKPEQGGDFVRRLLAERLAATDTQRALELGKKTGERRILAAAIECIAQENGARAIRTAAELPEEQRGKIWESITFNNAVTPGGTFEEMAAALKESPGLLGRERGITRMLGLSLAVTALQDPKAALDLVKTLGPELVPSANEEENNGGGGRRYRRGGPDASPTAQLLQSTLSEVRSISPEAASRLFDSLSPEEKSAWMHSEEAISRFQSKGIESAIQFAEKQSDSESARFAALGTWSALVQRDRDAAFRWIDSLPEGSFRQGVLTGVMIDTWRNSSTWGSERAAIEAGTALQNPATRLDYYQYLLQRPLGARGTSRAETVEILPISDPEKRQLLQRIAPIR